MGHTKKFKKKSIWERNIILVKKTVSDLFSIFLRVKVVLKAWRLSTHFAKSFFENSILLASKIIIINFSKKEN